MTLSIRTECSVIDSKTESKAVSQMLAQINQNHFLTFYALDQGQCCGITTYWLLSHKFSQAKTFAELKAQEPAHLQALAENFADCLLLQKNFKFAHSFFSQRNPVSDLGIAIFALQGKDARIAGMIPYTDIAEDPSHTPSQRAYLYVEVLRNTIENAAVMQQHINFGYCWKNQLVKHGHSVGIIKNPVAGCDILFFDSNYYSSAFATKEEFYAFLPEYFAYVLTPVGIPTGYSAGYVVESALKPALKLLPKPLINTMFQGVTIEKPEVPEICIDIRACSP